MSTFQPSKSQVLTVTPISADSEKSVVRINLCGTNQRVINHLSETTYEVISGKGTMEVNGEVINLEPGVKVTVPAEVPYTDWGTVEMIATSTPPFDIRFVEVLP
jgi:mannose-6-phosphate isomerase-like protein (cupin superfamily)